MPMERISGILYLDGGGLLIEDAVYGEVNADGTIKLTDQYGNEVDEPVINETYVEAQDFYLRLLRHQLLPCRFSMPVL